MTSRINNKMEATEHFTTLATAKSAATTTAAPHQQQ